MFSSKVGSNLQKSTVVLSELFFRNDREGAKHMKNVSCPDTACADSETARALPTVSEAAEANGAQNAEGITTSRSLATFVASERY